MKIVVFSLGVMFENVVQGGSQKVLRDLAIGLAQRGHTVTILCPYRADNSRTYTIVPCAVVKPILPLRGAFPLPYGVSPFALTEVCRIVQKEIKDADLLYCHDGGLNIEFLKNQIPTVISLRDFCYTETLLGALNFNEERIIVNSMHTFMCLQDSFQQVNPRIKEKISIVFNGYEGTVFKRREISQAFYEQTGLSKKENEIIIGFPHRPDSDKGFMNALKVISKMREKWGDRIKLLIPQYMDKGMSDRTDETYNEINRCIKNMNLSKHIVTYDWISHEKMPEFYSYCDIILCIGCFVEAFSNVSVESLLCGTPVVAANTSTYKTMPIRQYLNIVPYGDTGRTIRAIEDILNGRGNELKEARNYILNNLTVDKMIDGFERIFLESIESFRTRSEYNNQTINPVEPDCMDVESARVRLSSWCQCLEGKIFNDYTHIYTDDVFQGIFEENNEPIKVSRLRELGIRSEAIEENIKNGNLIYIIE